MTLSKKTTTLKAGVLRRKKVRHVHKLKRFKQCAQQKLEITLRKIKAFNIKPRIRQTFRQVRHITSARNVKKVYTDRDSRIRSGAAMGTALLMSVFTGSIVLGVAQAAASSVVSSAISEAYKEKKSPMDEAMEVAKSQYSSPPFITDGKTKITSPQKKNC